MDRAVRKSPNCAKESRASRIFRGKARAYISRASRFPLRNVLRKYTLFASVARPLRKYRRETASYARDNRDYRHVDFIY